MIPQTKTPQHRGGLCPARLSRAPCDGPAGWLEGMGGTRLAAMGILVGRDLEASYGLSMVKMGLYPSLNIAYVIYTIYKACGNLNPWEFQDPHLEGPILCYLWLVVEPPL